MISNKFRFPGWMLLTLAVIFTILYFGFNFKFEMNVFAIHSSFFETKMFTFFKTNFADELILLLYICGFALTILSREKDESPEIDKKRHIAMRYALLINFILQVFVILFIYGQGFIAFLVLNLINLPLLYLVLFTILKKRSPIKS